MIHIDRLKFENYRQYGTAEINFGKRDGADTYLFAFVAQNGTGKTTMLRAINWCLYGNENHDPSGKFRTSNIEKGNSQALPLVNKKVLETAKIKETIPVSVSFRFIDEKSDVIEFKRIAYYKKQSQNSWTMSSPKLEVTITPSDGSNTESRSDDDADSVVKQYFDPAISNFYFFDGEKLSDFFDTPLKKSIYNIAQVNMLENAINHIKNIKNSYNRQLGKELPDIGLLQKEIESKENAAKANENSMMTAQKKMKRLEEKSHDLSQKLLGFQPVQRLQERREELIKEQKQIEEESIRLKTAQSAFIREYLVVLRMYPLVKKVYSYIADKREKNELPPDLDRNAIKDLLEHPDKPCPICGSHISENQRHHLEELLDKYAISTKTSNYLSSMMGPLESLISKAENYENNRDMLRKSIIELDKKRKTNQTNMNGIDEQISQFGGDAGIKDISKVNQLYNETLDELTQSKADIKVYKAAAESAKKDLFRLQKELEEYETKAAIRTEVKDKLRVLSKLAVSFTKIKDTIVTETENEMQELTWEYFQSMIWKKNTFGKVVIDDDYNVTVYDQGGRAMTDSMSETEKMALAYAFTLAVHKVSGKNCPLVIDSPLGRVSDKNRENMAGDLLRCAKDKQIIMLFTPDEYSPAVATMYDKEATVNNWNLSPDESLVEGVER